MVPSYPKGTQARSLRRPQPAFTEVTDEHGRFDGHGLASNLDHAARKAATRQRAGVPMGGAIGRMQERQARRAKRAARKGR